MNIIVDPDSVLWAFDPDEDTWTSLDDRVTIATAYHPEIAGKYLVQAEDEDTAILLDTVQEAFAIGEDKYHAHRARHVDA